MQLLITMQGEIIRFDFLKELYEKDEDFEEIWKKCLTRQPAKDYHIMNGFLFKENWLCPKDLFEGEGYYRLIGRRAWWTL